MKKEIEIKKGTDLQKNEFVKAANDNKIKPKSGYFLQPQIDTNKPRESVVETIEYPKEDIKIIAQTPRRVQHTRPEFARDE